MNPNWLFLIVPAAVMAGVFGAYYANTYRGMGGAAPQDVTDHEFEGGASDAYCAKCGRAYFAHRTDYCEHCGMPGGKHFGHCSRAPAVF